METPEDRFFRELGGAYAEIRQAFARHVGMSSPRLQVLMRLWRNGETSHSDLRQALSLDGASVTRLIKEFEAEGMVSRRIDPADNRYTLACLTPVGQRAAADLEQSHQSYQVRLLDGVTAQEQEIVLRALKRLCANVACIERDPAGDSPAAIPTPYSSVTGRADDRRCESHRVAHVRGVQHP